MVCAHGVVSVQPQPCLSQYSGQFVAGGEGEGGRGGGEGGGGGGEGGGEGEADGGGGGGAGGGDDEDGDPTALFAPTAPSRPLVGEPAAAEWAE